MTTRITSANFPSGENDRLHDIFSLDCMCKPSMSGNDRLLHYPLADALALENNRMLKELLAILKEN